MFYTSICLAIAAIFAVMAMYAVSRALDVLLDKIDNDFH